jgi:hypothetical protein
MADLGSRWTRIDIGWHDFEPSPGVYNAWSVDAYRVELQRARAAGQKIMVMVSTAPQWATGSSNPNTPPRDPADYARFLSYLGAQYGQYVDAWEVWNEPNTARFWSTGPSPSAYAALVKAAYPAVKAADPGAPVVMGATSLNDNAFLQGAYAAGVKGYFDALSTHPYTCDAPDVIKRDASGHISKYSFAGYRELRDTMLANGDDKPIWLTEFGWSTSTQGCALSEATQADYVTRAFKFVEQDPYVQVALVYNLRNNFYDGDADTTEARYGLMRTDFSPKPSYAAFKAYATGSPSSANLAPTVSLTAPTPGATFNTSLALAARAGDDQSVSRVDFLVDNQVVGSDTTAPYSMTWKVPKKLAYGSHTVSARAYDGAGLSTTDTRTVTRSASGLTLTVSVATTASATRVHAPRAAITARGRVTNPRLKRVRITLLQVKNGRTRAVKRLRVAIRHRRFSVKLGAVARGAWLVEAQAPGMTAVRSARRI